MIRCFLLRFERWNINNHIQIVLGLRNYKNLSISLPQTAAVFDSPKKVYVSKLLIISLKSNYRSHPTLKIVI